nr:MAG TPA: hypothetical protein [Bacteriophage sp.]
MTIVKVVNRRIIQIQLKYILLITIRNVNSL